MPLAMRAFNVHGPSRDDLISESVVRLAVGDRLPINLVASYSIDLFF